MTELIHEGKPATRLHLSPLLPYLTMENLTDFHINRPNEIVVVTSEKRKIITDVNLDLKKLMKLARHLAVLSEKIFDEDSPSFSCALPKPYGFRAQVDAYSTVDSGFMMSVRLGAALCLPLSTYFSEEDCKKVKDAIRSGKHIFVIGATGSGKTSLCNSLIQNIPEMERIITVEDPKELFIPKDEHDLNEEQKKQDWVFHPDQGRIELYKGVGMSLMRHAPQRLIVGEVRELNVMVFLNALNTGHGGVLATFHANSASEAKARIVELAAGLKDGNMAFDENYILKKLNNVGLIIEMKVHEEEGKVKRDKPNLVWM